MKFEKIAKNQILAAKRSKNGTSKNDLKSCVGALNQNYERFNFFDEHQN